MRFALFYEIPVPKPWTKDSDHVAYKNTLEQALIGRSSGWDAFWTVEHHFLDEYSLHCSNPEVLLWRDREPHEAHAPRLRRAAHAEAVQSPGAHG